MAAIGLAGTQMAQYKSGYQALRKGRASIRNQIYLVTSTTRNRNPLFSEWRLASIACRNFEKDLLLKDATMLAWVLMPDHAHWLVQLGTQLELGALMMRIKSAAAREINRTRNRKEPVWDRGFHDRALRQEEDIAATARYIVANPLRAGLVKRVGDYPYWNAIWL
ncbi:REP-associated tyrosine transposase [Microbulbifer magnicolonia]|uniref:REP-associated tyrosine transposase n=1 Tax=Microbulbifer magnicolonia TaxID=3109744 RepID=UPI002B4027C9|nr:transposase [Microbulbifer sp. GG15]